MKTNDKILARASRTFAAPRGYKGQFIITAQAYFCGGNAHPHFSVTGETSDACGCLHDDAAKAWPAIRPIIALHLANADDGEPMHGEANGFYNLAGTVKSHFGQEYHVGNSNRHFPIKPDPATPWRDTEYRFPTMDEAIDLTAEYLRVDREWVERARNVCLAAWQAGRDSVAIACEPVTARTEKEQSKAGAIAAKAAWKELVDTLRPQWAQEAADGLALIRALSTKPEAVAA